MQSQKFFGRKETETGRGRESGAMKEIHETGQRNTSYSKKTQIVLPLCLQAVPSVSSRYYLAAKTKLELWNS